jgi:integrase
LTQHDCEHAPPAFTPDGLPKPKLYRVGAPGLYLQVSPGRVREDGSFNISRSFIYKFSIDGNRDSMGLGSLAELPLAAALGKAYTLQEKVNRKENPVAEEQRARSKRDEERNRPAPITFREAAVAYCDAHESEWTAKNYRAHYIAVLERHVFPAFGDLPVADVTVEDILRALEPLWRVGKTKTGKDARGRTADVLGWAMAKGYRPKTVNPATWSDNLEHLLAKPKKAKKHPSLPYERAGAFMRELRSKNWLGARCTEFAILTCSRAAEAIGAKFGEIDWNHRCGPVWTVPAERMKKRLEHVVPLSEAAQALVKAAMGDRKPDPDELIFPGHDGKPLAENSLLKSVQRIDASTTQHGWRSTFSRWRQDRTHFSSELAEHALAHRKKGVEGVYNDATAIIKRRELMEEFARFLDIVEDENKVVTLKVRG